MQCDRCKRNVKTNETMYTVQYGDSTHPEEICGLRFDRDGEKISEFIELGYLLIMHPNDVDRR